MIDVAKTCAPLLAELGFKKRAGDVFTVDLDEDVLGWLGLNRATEHRPAGEVEINPVVGVRHQVVERIVAECRGEKFHAYQPPTVSTPLGYPVARGPLPSLGLQRRRSRRRRSGDGRSDRSAWRPVHALDVDASSVVPASR